jgi:prevent-host-death family protein
MREIQASEAKTHLPQLLDDVERGETIVITRHGRAIARIVPEAHLRQAEVDRAIANIKSIAAAHRKDHRRRACLG